MQKIDRTDPEFCSLDIKGDKLKQFKRLFPEVFTDGKVDFEVFRHILGEAADESNEKYGLDWFGKRSARQFALLPSVGTLRPAPEDSVNWDTSPNLMIEGDNLEILKLLQKSYAGRVKLIYIDPPYNTGKDFIYADKYQDSIRNYLILTGQTDSSNKPFSSNTEASGRFHTDWLNMIYPRLRLARTLLSNDGLIFASIDHVELANLRLVMDEIFGSENFFAILTRKAMHTVRNSSADFNLHADFLLVYGVNKNWFSEEKSRNIREPKDKSKDYRLNDQDGRGPYKLDPLHARNYYKPYTHTFVNGVTWSAPAGSFPRYSRETLTRMEVENRIQFGSNQPMAKRFLREVQEGVPPDTILKSEVVGYNSDGTKELREALGQDKVFPQPKPTKLIRYLLRLVNDTEAIVLDFFAGSGTTAQAVWEANIEDDGQRRFILVQLPEPFDAREIGRTAAQFCDSIDRPHTIAEITKERLRRVGSSLRSTNQHFKGDLGFRVFKLDTSNIRVWDPHPKDLDSALRKSLEHVEPNRSEQDILYELLLRRGIDLCVAVSKRTISNKTVFAVESGDLMICMDQTIARCDVEPLAMGIADWHDSLDSSGETTVVFRDNAFVDDVCKTNIAAILEQRGLTNVKSL